MSEIKWWGDHDGIGFPHVIMSQQFSREQLERLFRLTSILKKRLGKGQRVDWLYNFLVCTLFYEPSTRTRFSFETAAFRLGAGLISSENAAQFSSAIKGETLEDSIRVIADKACLIVLRHKETGSAARAAKVSGSTPIINGGDGMGQHPSQALLDGFTIIDEFGDLEGKIVAMTGDLKRGRTVRSLCYLLAKFSGIKIIFVAPPAAQMKQDIKDHLTENGIEWSESNNLLKVAELADVIYMTRYQLERAESTDERVVMEKAAVEHVINRRVVNAMKETSIVMHPLPRVEEIRWSVDVNLRARYFQQAVNGDFVRMALLLCQLNPQKALELLGE